MCKSEVNAARQLLQAKLFFSARLLHECDVTNERNSTLKAFRLAADNETWSPVLPSSRPSTNMTEARAAGKLIFLAKKTFFCVQQIMYRRAEKKSCKVFDLQHTLQKINTVRTPEPRKQDP